MTRRAIGLAAVVAAALTIGGAAAATAPYDPFFAAPATIADFGAASRPFGVAAGDFDGDGNADLVIGRTTGNVAFVKGNGDGTFAAPAVFLWKQAFFNGWAFTPADINGDSKLDVVWGANATSTGCSVSPIPVGSTCAGAGGTTITVNDGDVRVWYGNGDGTFQETTYFVSGVRHNGGSLLGRIGTADAGSVAAGDVDRDGDVDVVAGGVDGTTSVVKLLRNGGDGSFAPTTIVSESTTCTATTCNQIYFPAISTQNSPWGLAVGDADGDGDADLFVGDRALYVYLYRNDGTGAFTLQGGNTALATRPNVYLRHDTFRAAVGFTPSLAAADVNGDAIADPVLGLHSGTQTPASGTPNDGTVLLDVSRDGGHSAFGPLADVGTMARGVSAVDVNGDGALDLVAAEYDGKVKLLRQLAPIDSDGDGISDYVDNALSAPNAPRLDMNTDGAVTYRDQLDNDFDTVLGNPEDSSTWQRTGDPADSDDDNDGVGDEADNCPLVANAGQANADGDLFGDGCDPLDDRDRDSDGVPTGPMPDEAGFDATRAAAIKWSTGNTHFVIRIDALGRFFQNEFTQLMTDAATLSPTEWAAKCWENYDPGDIPGDSTYEPCGDDASRTLTLGGGKSVPVTLVVIPKQLWTDPPVVAWVNDRNDNERFELGQHGTYHVNNVPASDWKDLADRNFFSCEPCGLTEAESFESMKIGHDTLLGNYDNRWIQESGATAASPKIDWSSSASPLLSYAPPFNTSDGTGRRAIAQLGFKAFSASVFEEEGFYAPIFTPEGSHHEAFDQFGMFHDSADLELEPPDTTGDAYDRDAYEAYLRAQTDEGGLTTWLIEEVEWSGRPCQNADRLGTCNGGSNRENNTVYLPRWEGWLQLLDYVRGYPGGVVMTMGEVALAKAYDNAPTAANPSQADADHDGIGDAIDGATLAAAAAELVRNQAGELVATLRNGAGAGIVGQAVTFAFDADGDGTSESYAGTTDADGVARAPVTPTRPVGSASFDASWDGLRGVAASASGSVEVGDTTSISLDPENPAGGQVTDAVLVAATLLDSSGQPLEGRTLTFAIDAATATAITDSAGRASATLVLAGPARTTSLSAGFAGAGAYAASSSSAAFTVAHEDTSLALPDAVASKNARAVARATLTEADGAALAGRTVHFAVADKVGGEEVVTVLGSATTDAAGVASLEIPPSYVSPERRKLRARFDGDESFLAASATAFAYRQ